MMRVCVCVRERERCSHLGGTRTIVVHNDTPQQLVVDLGDDNHLNVSFGEFVLNLPWDQ